ncbi:MAG: hypothetical protein WD016_06300 [Balneolaceae bacterium]
MEKIFYIPGISPYEDLRIISLNNETIQYDDLKQKLGNSFKYLNLNYPIELQERNFYSASILSFYRDGNQLYLAQTMISDKEEDGRRIPITKILVVSNIFFQKAWLKELKKGFEQVNYPNFEFDFFTKTSLDKNNKYIKGVENWSKEQEHAFVFILNKIHENRSVSGKSMVFNEKEKELYDTFIFYSKKKYSKQLILLSLLILALLIVLAIILLNT